VTAGLYVAAAFNGHSFQLSPAVGRAIADDLLSGGAPEPADFSPGRFRAPGRR
jgi:glycine/D-amino acid oxidase-like deaminating enzyme